MVTKCKKKTTRKQTYRKFLSQILECLRLCDEIKKAYINDDRILEKNIVNHINEDGIKPGIVILTVKLAQKMEKMRPLQCMLNSPMAVLAQFLLSLSKTH